MSNEAIIFIGNTPITHGESCTIRNALSHFDSCLFSDGLGDDDHGKRMVELYRMNIRDLLIKIEQNIESQNN